MKPHEPFVLTQMVRQSEAWATIKRHLLTRLEDLRRDNDTSLDEKATAQLRGRIAELKRLIALGDEPNLPPE